LPIDPPAINLIELATCLGNGSYEFAMLAFHPRKLLNPWPPAVR
jgi:hypothetical protein